MSWNARDILRQTWPEWEILDTIGHGGYGTVYRARRNNLGGTSFAALKFIFIPQNDQELEEVLAEEQSEEAARAYFRREVESIAAEIQSMNAVRGNTHVVSIDDYKIIAQPGGIHWAVLIRMELLTPLRAHIAGRVPDEREIIRIGMDLCSALDVCRQNNIVHRDIKPANIFVNGNGEYKLGDFGVARQVEGRTNLSQVGTPTYIAPELLLDVNPRMNIDAAARMDICSLGLVLYWLANGKRIPFQPAGRGVFGGEERRNAIARRLRGEPLPAPENVSPGLAGIILKACAFMPEDRYAGARELMAALTEQLRHPDRAAAEAEEAPRKAAPELPPAPELPSAPDMPAPQPRTAPGARERTGRRGRRFAGTAAALLLACALLLAAAAILLGVLLWRSLGPGNGPDAAGGPGMNAAVSTAAPTEVPTAVPTAAPTDVPTAVPTEVPTAAPTEVPTAAPTEVPTAAPTEVPTAAPTAVPTEVPTAAPTEVPTAAPTDVPTAVPTEVPTAVPAAAPTAAATEAPAEEPEPETAAEPAPEDTATPYPSPVPPFSVYPAGAEYRIMLSQNEVILFPGSHGQIRGSIEMLSSGERVDRLFVWSSADESIATVSENGTITAVAPGTTVVTAHTSEKPEVYAIVIVHVREKQGRRPGLLSGAALLRCGAGGRRGAENRKHPAAEYRGQGTGSL